MYCHISSITKVTSRKNVVVYLLGTCWSYLLLNVSNKPPISYGVNAHGYLTTIRLYVCKNESILTTPACYLWGEKAVQNGVDRVKLHFLVGGGGFGIRI